MRIISCRIWNIIYTEGVLKGFIVKQLRILFCIKFLHKIRRINIPLWVMRYDRKYAEHINQLSKQIRKEEEANNEEK